MHHHQLQPAGVEIVHVLGDEKMNKESGIIIMSGFLLRSIGHSARYILDFLLTRPLRIFLVIITGEEP